MVLMQATLVLVSTCFGGIPLVAGKGFLREQNAISAAETYGEDLQVAFGELMGCGGEIDNERLTNIEQALQPIWRTLPKNAKWKVEWRSLRYMTHRYFMKASSLFIRGFEPLLASNTSDAGILTQRIPMYVDTVLGGKHKDGFSLQDASYLIAALEQMIFDSETHLLEKIYGVRSIDPKSILSLGKMKDILEAYMVYWMMGDDQDSIDLLMNNRTLLEDAFPHWKSLESFVEGRINMLRFQRVQKPRPGHAGSVMAQEYDFDDAHKVVGGITQSFQYYWESECEDMKRGLMAMDKVGSGRVHLADFYKAGLKDEWRFGESEAYLREMGVLDESATFYGKQVIISNYLQGASNCIVTTAQYRVCCSNPCQDIQSEIETSVGSAMALPSQIFEIVGNMTTEDDDPIKLSQMLVDQLHRVAEPHGGKVPIHGRLFSQWLHYVFPTDCAFPYKSGSVSMASPLEFGDFIAKKSDMRKHVREKRSTQNETDLQSTLMSQWSSEEEFFADYSLDMKAPWEATQSHLALGGFVFIVMMVLMGALFCGGKGTAALDLPLSVKSGKSHWV